MRKGKMTKACIVAIAALFLTLTFLEISAEARAGGGRSFGSRGSRSYSAPSRSYSSPQPARPAPAPYQQPAPQQNPSGGGFWRGMGGGILGGIAGGLLGGMLFRSLGFGSMGGGGFGGSGIGLFEILLIGGIGYMIYRMVKKKNEADRTYNDGQSYREQPYGYGSQNQQDYGSSAGAGPRVDDASKGLADIKQMDYSFDEQRFKDNVMDIFFKIQGAWMNRDINAMSSLLTDEMKRTFQTEIDGFIREGKINRLENIAVRSVEVMEAWQESGEDYITVLVYANLLDYTVDEKTGSVVAGNKIDPIKFEEYWTFSRPVGANPWRLSAINQV